MGETTMDVRLSRLAEAERRSREVLEDDVRARDTAMREADAAGYSVRRIARLVGMSPANTHRIVAGISGPAAA